jgi:hypothetical protein
MSQDTTHLAALHHRLGREHSRMIHAKTDKERQLREVYVCQIEKEIDGELKFLGLESKVDAEIQAMDDDQLLKELLL